MKRTNPTDVFLDIKGVNIFLVSKRAGHSNISTTVDVYGHLFTSVDDDLIQRLETEIRASWN